MTKAPVSLQDLRRKIYAKAKAEPHWRFWGRVERPEPPGLWLGAVEYAVAVRTLGLFTATGRASICGKHSRLYRSHNPWHEANR